MLNGGGINPDGLSLDLQFAADKTLTARRGPTPVFTRSSGDNGGTTYFGPLVDFDEATAFSTTGISNGRASWFKSYEGTDITISYTGARWRVVTVDNGDEVTYLAAPGSEWRPDQADWSGQDLSVTTSSTFGIVKAANNEPRFDHTSAGVCRGLLIEEGRTNLLLQSENFASSSWNAGLVTRTSDQIAAPNGASTADLITSIAGNFGGKLAQVISFAATTYTASVFVKKGNWRYIGITLADISNSGRVASFDFDTETVSANGVPNANIGFQKLSSGWYRIFLTLPTTAVTGSFDIWMTTSTGAVVGPIGSGQTVYTWGAQLEAGSFPTSYIPTTTGTLARSADVCSITGGNFNNFYNQSEGTVVAVVSEFRRGVHYLPIVRFAISSNVGGNRFQIGTNGNKTGDSSPIEFIGLKAGVTQYQSFATSPTPESRAALAYKTDDIRGALNGILSAADSPPSEILAGANLMTIGTLGLHIESIRYYRKRLSNEKLQALTA